MVYMYTFVVTNMDSTRVSHKILLQRGRMETSSKKANLVLISLLCHARIVNANRLQYALRSNIFKNWRYSVRKQRKISV